MNTPETQTRNLDHPLTLARRFFKPIIDETVKDLDPTDVPLLERKALALQALVNGPVQRHRFGRFRADLLV